MKCSHRPCSLVHSEQGQRCCSRKQVAKLRRVAPLFRFDRVKLANEELGQMSDRKPQSLCLGHVDEKVIDSAYVRADSLAGW